MTRILIVDDNPMVRRGVRQVIELHSGWEVCGEAIDGQDSIQKTSELVPDVIIMDLQMPRMNGIEASLDIIKNMPDMPILLFTAHLSAQLIVEAERAGIKGAISKDRSSDIGNGISALLRQETFFQPHGNPSTS